MTKLGKKWLVLSQKQQELEALLATMPGLSPLVGKILFNRGLKNKLEVEEFLSLDLENLHSPFLLPDIDLAVERILLALERKEKVLVYGDYDVDGITSTTVLLMVLTALEGTVEYYLPHRLEEGYGINKDALTEAKERGISLIITVDCGISAREEVDWANSNGLDMIITDHHHPGPVIPSALAVINPKREDSSYPFKELAGVGVAYKLAQALLIKANFPKQEELLESLRELVALGTIADVVPLVYENRILVKNGLTALEKTKNLGILALKQIAGLEEKEITPHTIGFALAPRINALGRLCCSEMLPEFAAILRNSSSFTMAGGLNAVCLAVELFLTSCPERAKLIAVFLDEENRRRQAIESEILEKALEMAEKEWDQEKEKILVLGSENWHLGVIGIVASRLMERYYRPVILLSFKDGKAKGSARSVKGFHLFEALSQCSDLLEKYGGHELAAGLSLDLDKLPAFRQKINLVAEEMIVEDLLPSLNIEVDEVDLDQLNFDVLEQLEALAPYGCENPQPLLACREAKLVEYRAVGNSSKHLKLRVATGKEAVDGIAFGLGAACLALDNSKAYDLAFSLDRNEWKNKVSLQLKVEAIQENNCPENYFYLTEIVSGQGEKIPDGTIVDLEMEGRAIKVRTRQGDELGFLNSRLDKKIRPYLRDGASYSAWSVRNSSPSLKIAISLNEEPFRSCNEKKKIFLYPSSLECICHYNQQRDKKRTALGHGALPSYQISKIIAYWSTGGLDSLFLTRLFFQNYQSILLEKIDSSEVEILELEGDISSYEDTFLAWKHLFPSRDLLAFLYRTFKMSVPKNAISRKPFLLPLDLAELAQQLRAGGIGEMGKKEVAVGIDTLEEMGLLEREVEGKKQYLSSLPEPQGKFDLTTLLRYREHSLLAGIL